jgi:hypothetical protein
MSWTVRFTIVAVALLTLQSGSALAADLVPEPPGIAHCSGGSGGTVCLFSRSLDFDNEPLFGVDGQPMMCGSSQLTEDGTLTLNIKWTYNADGLLTQIQRHFNAPRADFTISNPGTGKTLPNPGHWNETYESVEPGSFPPVAILTTTGNFFHINAPHDGAVYVDVGRIQFSPDFEILSEAGPKAFFDNESLVGLCAALT